MLTYGTQGDTGDGKEVRRIAHLLKGSSATMGARELSEACQALLAGESATELEGLASQTLDALRAELLDDRSSSRRAA